MPARRRIQRFKDGSALVYHPGGAVEIVERAAAGRIKSVAIQTLTTCHDAPAPQPLKAAPARDLTPNGTVRYALKRYATNPLEEFTQ